MCILSQYFFLFKVRNTSNTKLTFPLIICTINSLDINQTITIYDSPFALTFFFILQNNPFPKSYNLSYRSFRRDSFSHFYISSFTYLVLLTTLFSLDHVRNFILVRTVQIFIVYLLTPTPTHLDQLDSSLFVFLGLLRPENPGTLLEFCENETLSQKPVLTHSP